MSKFIQLLIVSILVSASYQDDNKKQLLFKVFKHTFDEALENSDLSCYESQLDITDEDLKDLQTSDIDLNSTDSVQMLDLIFLARAGCILEAGYENNKFNMIESFKNTIFADNIECLRLKLLSSDSGSRLLENFDIKSVEKPSDCELFFKNNIEAAVEHKVECKKEIIKKYKLSVCTAGCNQPEVLTKFFLKLGIVGNEEGLSDELVDGELKPLYQEMVGNNRKLINCMKIAVGI